MTVSPMARYAAHQKTWQLETIGVDFFDADPQVQRAINTRLAASGRERQEAAERRWGKAG